jgi:hypothetical protein
MAVMCGGQKASFSMAGLPKQLCLSCQGRKEKKKNSISSKTFALKQVGAPTVPSAFIANSGE